MTKIMFALKKNLRATGFGCRNVSRRFELLDASRIRGGVAKKNKKKDLP